MLIFRPVFRLAFIEKKSSIYIIAFFNIITDLIQLIIVCLYLSPNIMQSDYILTGSQTSASNIFVGWIFINSWYIESFVQVVMAVNRYVIQFVFISVFYVCTWGFFEVFPRVVPKDRIEYFWIITVFVILNTSSNSVIFLTCNKDIKRLIDFPWIKKKIYVSAALSKISKATTQN
ncbi:unnamed protein product [Caenorhabditis nigoni]